MKSLQAQFSSCKLLIDEHSESAATEACSGITPAVLIRIWQLTHSEKQANYKQTPEGGCTYLYSPYKGVPPPPEKQTEQKRSFHDYQSGLGFHVAPGFSVSADCHNYTHDDLGDWSWENNRKS